MRIARKVSLLLAVGILAVFASPAFARRLVPAGFFGVVAPPLLNDVSAQQIDQQVGLMASSGVESVRLSFGWSQLEPSRGVFIFSTLDRVVAAAARHHLRPILDVSYTPPWNSSGPSGPESWRYPPKDVGEFAKLMRLLVLRYGPHGSLFRSSGIPAVPIREWQLWNEQDAPWYWKDSRWPSSYTKLLRATYPAIHGLDHGATVVAGSLVASSASESPWRALHQMYVAGARRYFDAIAVHPFTDTASSVALSMNHLVTIVQRMRAEMRRNHDGGKPLLITEMTWSAAAGKVPKRALLGFETTPHGQAVRLAAAYNLLAKQRRALGVQQVFWSTWATQYDAVGDLSDMIFRFTGLVRFSGSSFSSMPILKTYSNTAARLEGCRKNAFARCR